VYDGIWSFSSQYCQHSWLFLIIGSLRTAGQDSQWPYLWNEKRNQRII
jgi:hypothetical protein